MGSSKHDKLNSNALKCGDFIYQLKNYQLFKNNFASLNYLGGTVSVSASLCHVTQANSPQFMSSSPASFLIFCLCFMCFLLARSLKVTKCVSCFTYILMSSRKLHGNSHYLHFILERFTRMCPTLSNFR